MQKEDGNKRLRLIFPQWQGGNNPPYYLGAQLLNWLAPEPRGIVEEVAVATPTETALPEEHGLVARSALIEQLKEAKSKIEKHQPDHIVVLGGDCLVDLAPFSYLNEKYGDELAILWIDAHPDIMTPEQFNHAHAMVLGNLMGYGDEGFTQYVTNPVKPENVCYVGVNSPTQWEADKMASLTLNNVSPEEVAMSGGDKVVEWFKGTGAKYLAVHFDLDALDPNQFGPLLFNKPGAENEFEGIAQGKLTVRQVIEILKQVSKVSDVVGLGITEHLPWDALALQNMLRELPLIGTK